VRIASAEAFALFIDAWIMTLLANASALLDVIQSDSYSSRCIDKAILPLPHFTFETHLTDTAKAMHSVEIVSEIVEHFKPIQLLNPFPRGIIIM
jgi:hypothetical protein